MEGIVLQQENFTREDILYTAAIQWREIQEGFFVSLGNKALELFISHMAESEYGILIVARDSMHGRICGFVSGATHVGKFYKDFMLKKSFLAAVTLAPMLLLSPSKVWGIFEMFLSPGKKKHVTPDAELLVIAVDEQYKGKGVAQLLFHQLANTFQSKHIDTFKVCTLANTLRPQRFYEKMGARKEAQIEAHGQDAFLYIYEIDEARFT